jgi:hypothetical protein
MSTKLVLASLAVLAAASSAQAQIAAEHPRYCVMSVGPTQMMFSAFQENRTDEIFCQRISDVGKTMIILDAKSTELRDMNIEVRLLRNIGQKDWRDDLEATTLTVLPRSKYLVDRGTTSFAYDFGKEGEYIALVRATSDDGAKEYVGEYYFTVGATYGAELAAGSLAAAAGVAGLAMWRRGQNGKTAKAKAAEPAKPAGSAASQSP